MANQQGGRWENRGKEIAAQATDAAITKLQEELQGKRAELGQLDKELEETSVAQKLAKRSQLQQEVAGLEEELDFTRNLVKPKLVWAGGQAGRYGDGHRGCLG